MYIYTNIFILSIYVPIYLPIYVQIYTLKLFYRILCLYTYTSYRRDACGTVNPMNTKKISPPEKHP